MIDLKPAFLFLFLLTGLFSCQNTSDSGEVQSKADPPTRQEAPAPPSQRSDNKQGSETTNRPPGMVWIPGGTFELGSDDASASRHEGPAHPVTVNGFWMDITEVTNAQFAEFVEATGYVTVAERPVDWEELKKQVPPGTPKPPDEVLQPGSLVFTPPDHAVGLSDYTQWWSWKVGANWRHPNGPDSSIEGKDDYPVTHIAFEDAQAYAEWAGKRLPTEAEWEFAALGGAGERPFAWGDELTPDGAYLANFFQGSFPFDNTARDGYERLAPVMQYPPNGYGLYDMIGNVWEWTTDWYRPDTYAQQAASRPLANPTGPTSSFDPQDPYVPKRVTKGGSFLCSNEYCSNYRPSARMATAFDSGQEHLGFRCVKD